MGIVSSIKNEALGNKTKIQTSESAKLEAILNKMFYLEKKADEESEFVKQVCTRGLETQERVGLHASALIVPDNKFCYREQVLSLFYKQLQGEQINVNLRRIFEEGNAIHEKWQRLFIRAGYSKVSELDVTKIHEKYEVSNTPDIICRIPEFYEGKMIGEIKSVNTFQYKKMEHHPSAGKQLQWYMFLRGIKKGFVLCEDKNTQEFKVEVIDFDENAVIEFIDRCENIQDYKQRLINDHKLVSRCRDCKSYDCKRAEKCAMKDVCWNRGKGKIKLNN